MKKILSTLAVIFFATSCSVIGSKPQVVYHRGDLKYGVNKVIIFPTTDFSGKVSDGAKSVDMSIIAAWGNVYGSSKTIPAGIAIEKIVNSIGKDAYLKLISSLDNASKAEQITANTAIKKFTHSVTEKLGNYDFALAIISGGEKEYNAGAPVYLHLGLFNSKDLTWRLITKIEAKKGAVGNWKVASQAMIANSFEEIKKLGTDK